MTPKPWLQVLQQQLGPQGLWLRDTRAGQAEHDPRFLPHERDWRGRYQGLALALARPADVDEVVAVVNACRAAGVSLVPQGGNTSLVGGSVPDASGQQILLNLGRLNRILDTDAVNQSMSVQAGCTLAQVQAAATEMGLMFPLRLASEGSCTIGGNLATNAGGTQVLRYGTARELCLGLQVVTAQGEVLQQLTALRKNNTGYDLRDLFIGSEGTLGIITAASLKLHPAPLGQAVALVPCQDMGTAVAMLQHARQHLDAALTAFEVMGQLSLDLLSRHEPQAAQPWQHISGQGIPPAWLVLMEVSTSVSPHHAQQTLQAWVMQWVADHPEHPADQTLLSQQSATSDQFWGVREAIPLAEKKEGLMVKHDIGLPTSAIPAFVDDMGATIQRRWPLARIVCFGHLGDGNLHYNVQPPPDARSGQSLAAFEAEVNTLVFDDVCRRQGTISAEHGIGALRADELRRRGSPVALDLMRHIKQALDPQGLFNPGRVLG